MKAPRPIFVAPGAAAASLVACVLVPRLRLVCIFSPRACGIHDSDVIIHKPPVWTAADGAYLLPR